MGLASGIRRLQSLVTVNAFLDYQEDKHKYGKPTLEPGNSIQLLRNYELRSTANLFRLMGASLQRIFTYTDMYIYICNP